MGQESRRFGWWGVTDGPLQPVSFLRLSPVPWYWRARRAFRDWDLRHQHIKSCNKKRTKNRPSRMFLVGLGWIEKNAAKERSQESFRILEDSSAKRGTRPSQATTLKRDGTGGCASISWPSRGCSQSAGTSLRGLAPPRKWDRARAPRALRLPATRGNQIP